MEVRKESVTVRVGKKEIPSVVITQPEQEDIQGSEPLTVDFDTDIFGGEPPIDISWEFGDGTTSSKPSPTHTYDYSASYPSYKATVTVTDSDGTEHSDTVSVRVTEN
jgi:PKD repeat protein